MKEYPSILGISDLPNNLKDLPCMAQEKIDGSNLRFCYNVKNGWYKFGTRHRIFDESDVEYGESISLFLNKYGSNIENIIHNNKQFYGVKEIICYCEFFGPYSFAGQHDPKHPALAINNVTVNKPYNLILFDINLHKKGLLEPETFMDIFGHLDVPKIIYKGNLTNLFIQDVKNGKYPVFEGVVCKGCLGKPPHGIWMYKIKTLNYLNEIKKRFKLNWEKYI